MENQCCECKKCKHYYSKSKCKRNKLNKHKKSNNYHSSSDSSSDNSMRKQSIKIKVDCNRGGEDTIKPKQCIKNQENDYKDDLLKYLISNKQQQIQPNLYQNNIKCFTNRIIINIKEPMCGFTFLALCN